MHKFLGGSAVVLIMSLYALGSILVIHMATAGADTLQSAHYQFEETDLGGGGLVPSASAHFQSVESTGDSAVGNSSSTNYQTEAGSQTTKDPALSFSVDSSSANFGAFSPTKAATATSTFSITNYTSYGYNVQIVGVPPTQGTHVISPMGTGPTGPEASQTGVNQFGINLVANTQPTSFGANPQQTIFGNGTAYTNYNTSNKFRYVSGDTIASASKSSGQTTFTISYIINVDSRMPGGQYKSYQSIICTGTY